MHGTITLQSGRADVENQCLTNDISFHLQLARFPVVNLMNEISHEFQLMAENILYRFSFILCRFFVNLAASVKHS